MYLHISGRIVRGLVQALQVLGAAFNQMPDKESVFSGETIAKILVLVDQLLFEIQHQVLVHVGLSFVAACRDLRVICLGVETGLGRSGPLFCVRLVARLWRHIWLLGLEFLEFFSLQLACQQDRHQLEAVCPNGVHVFLVALQLGFMIFIKLLGIDLLEALLLGECAQGFDGESDYGWFVVAEQTHKNIITWNKMRDEFKYLYFVSIWHSVSTKNGQNELDKGSVKFHFNSFQFISIHFDSF